MNQLRARGLDEGPFKAAVLDVVSQIPAGKVAEIGAIAESLGYPRNASPLVGWVIQAANSDVPWHRVTTPDGTLPERPGKHPIEQAALLGNEGIDVLPGPKVDLERYGWKPEPSRFRGPIVSYR
jgi:methylated-DNA-protein-cysteine methyltransferase-like protein